MAIKCAQRMYSFYPFDSYTAIFGVGVGWRLLATVWDVNGTEAGFWAGTLAAPLDMSISEALLG